MKRVRGVAVAVLIAIVTSAGLVLAQDRMTMIDQNPTPVRFTVVAVQTVANGSLVVVRDHGLPNGPCFYIYHSQYGAQLMPTPGGLCGQKTYF